MEIRKYATEAELDAAAAEWVAKTVHDKPNAVLGLPTGGTPVGMYANLVAMVKKGALSFGKVTTFNLDEYIGLSKEHPCSYYRFMYDNLFSHVDCPEEQVHLPAANVKDVHESCQAYEADIDAAGGIDLQVLGIGSNGHIGFNEPGTPADAFTHVTDLSETTIRDNARFFDSIDEVPRQAVTMGIASILKARKILLIVKGEGKAEIMRKLLEKKVSPDLPASYLHQHDDVLIMVDNAAGKYI